MSAIIPIMNHIYHQHHAYIVIS